MFNLNSDASNKISEVCSKLKIIRLKDSSISYISKLPTLRAILKYKDHLSILAIQSQWEVKIFRFTKVNAVFYVT